MTRKAKKKRVNLFLTTAVIVACYVAHMADCYRLKKTERRHGRKEESPARRGIQEGEIVFGRDIEKRSGLESQAVDGIGKTTSNASVEYRTFYQPDFADWPKGQVRDPSASDASWKRMAPSLQCGGNQMRFRAVGPGASKFALEQRDGPSIPLSQVPSTCGYRMQRNPLGLVMLVPYDGCNIVQEGGNYVLPMRWQGIPVSLWCPKPATPGQTTASPTPENPEVVAETATATTTTKPDVPTFLQHLSFLPLYPYFYPPLPVTTVAPTTTSTTTATTTTAAALPLMYPLPLYPSLYSPFPWGLPGPLPAAAGPITETNMTEPQLLPFPQNIPFYPQHLSYHPFFPPYPQYPMPETMETTSTTIDKTDPVQHHQHFHRFLPYFRYLIMPDHPPSR